MSSKAADEIYLRQWILEDALELLAYRVRNRAYCQPFEPTRSEEFFTFTEQRQVIENANELWKHDAAYGFGVRLTSTDELVGHINLSNVVRGVWQSCTLGYAIDERYIGRGLATEVVHRVVRFAFEQIGLHRVQAAVMPRNQASIRVLEKSSFRYEGLAEYYLKIWDAWEHHHIYSVTLEHWNDAKKLSDDE